MTSRSELRAETADASSAERLADALLRLSDLTRRPALVMVAGRVTGHAVPDESAPTTEFVSAVLHQRSPAVVDAGYFAVPATGWSAAVLGWGTAYRAGDECHVVVDDSACEPAIRADLLRVLNDVEAAVRTDSPRMSSQQRSLLRLVDGVGTDADAAALDMPLPGSRFVVLRHDAAPTDQVLREISAYRDVVIAAHRIGVVALARDVPRRAGEDRGLRTACQLAAVASRQVSGCTAGISSAIRGLSDLPAALRDAAEAAALAATDGMTCLAADDVWARLTTARLRRVAGDCLPLSHPLQRLTEYDERHGTDLVRTVGVWLRSQGNTVNASAQLVLHPNTLRYRLRRAQEISGLDLTDADQSLVVHVVAGVEAGHR